LVSAVVRLASTCPAGCLAAAIVFSLKVALLTFG
jgi:hypothetical protein